METKIKDYMTKLPKTIGKDTEVSKARAMMHELGCHHLPVLYGGKLVGIISDRDLKLVESQEHGEDTHVEDLMIDEPLVVDPDISVKEAVKSLLKEKVGSLIVRAKEDQPWGIFTTTDALQILATKLEVLD